MTPRQARIALGSFILLAAGVAFNAVYLQGEAIANRRVAVEAMGPRPKVDPVRRTETPQPGRNGLRATAPATDPTKRTALLKPDSAKVDAVPEVPQDEAGADTIRAIQRELKQRGYGPPVSDGIMRPITRAAIMAYEQETRLPLTGEASEALLKRLLLGAPATSDASGAGEVRSPHAEAVIKQVQRQLTAHGYRPGPIDGRLTAETVAAIRVFETDQGLVPRGRISAEIMTRLGDGVAGPKTSTGR